MSDTSKREELIEAAEVAIREAWTQRAQNPPVQTGLAECAAIAAFAVFEQAHTPTDDERTWVTGFLLGCGVAPDWAEEYAGKLLAAGFRRTAVQEPTAEEVDDEPCKAEVWSWDIFRHQEVDPYWMRCHRVGAHYVHENSETGATWRMPVPDTTGAES